MTTKDIPETITPRTVKKDLINAFFFNLLDHYDADEFIRRICEVLDTHTGVDFRGKPFTAIQLNVGGGYLRPDIDTNLTFMSAFDERRSLTPDDLGMAVTYLALLALEDDLEKADGHETILHRVKNSIHTLLTNMIGEGGANRHNLKHRATMVGLLHGPDRKRRFLGLFDD